MRLAFAQVLPLLCLMTLGAGLAPPVAADATATAGTAFDSSVCAGCHEDKVVGMFKVTYHGKLAEACTACHGDAETLAKHAEEGNPDLIKAPKEMTSREVAGLCLGCHEKGRQQDWVGSAHDRRGLACTNCHGIHDFKAVDKQLKTPQIMETCFNCHKEIRALTMRQSHHPVREGKITCADCHNPHGSNAKALLNANSVNELCYNCHTEKRGPFLWEHAPVRENCLNCHNPHGSNHDKLLVMKRPYLCQRCHVNTRHPGTLYDFRNSGASTTTATNRAVEHSCANCHRNIHGTNHPSGPYFGR